jgi:hypothetical protein
VKWFKNEIEDIEKYFLFNPSRDAEFKKFVEPYLESLGQDDDEEDDE